MLLLMAVISLFTLENTFSQTLESKLDAIFETAYPSGEPGAIVLIAKDGKPLYRKSFGLANLELNVAMKPEHVIELGSITKQFTAVAILMLHEQGKLSLQDPLSKYIADYPLGEKITIHQLLNHTSGIKSYTNMGSFMSLARTDMTPMEIIDKFKNEPMEFEPGERYNYNNSAYILLGYIIEEVSKMSYEDFIQKNIFDKLKMNHSYYGSKSKVIPNRASGYQPLPAGGFQNADYLSMTLPYAAGSLMSTVDDMLLWSQAVHNNQLISEKSKQLAFTSGITNDGKPIYYGYGWAINEINGTPSMEHGGGIFGYTTSGIYIPEQNIYAILLTNTNGKSPEDSNLLAVAEVLGKPYQLASTTKLTENELKKWTGGYQFEDTIRYITIENGSLHSQREGGSVLKLDALSPNEFIFEGSVTKYVFSEENGKKVALMSERIKKNKGIETDKQPEVKEALQVDAKTVQSYSGSYQLQPGFEIVVTSIESQLFAQATGQEQFELFAEKEDIFFAKITPLTIRFNKNAEGAVDSLTLIQGGQEMNAKKTK